MIKYLTLAEEKELLESIKGRYSERDKAIVNLAINTGVRVSELCGLVVNDVCNLEVYDIMNGRIRDMLLVRKEITKGKTEREIPLNEKAKNAIGSLLFWNQNQNFRQGPGNFLLISQKGKKFTRQQVQRIIKRARQRAALDIEATPHTLRHTFATKLYGKTSNLRIVQKLLGHKSVSTTQIYADVTRENLKDAVNLL